MGLAMVVRLIHGSLCNLAVCLLVAAAYSIASGAEETTVTSPLVARNTIGMSLVRIPTGEFLMGGQEPEERLREAFPEMNRKPGYFSDEYPQHRVSMSHDFLIGQFEVTVGQFRQF